MDGRSAIEMNNAAKAVFSPPPGLAVGVDIEDADNLPWIGAPAAEPFYVDNFTDAEIAYCVRQPNPRLSFCALWSAKEAALKCVKEFVGLRLIDIEICLHECGRASARALTASGGESVLNWVISISQAGSTCVAVCVRDEVGGTGRRGNEGESSARIATTGGA
jgi:phosphopantetheinyl transferase (holo-ACP synthase)